MDYLLLQILLFLILAAVIGFFIGWITRGFGFESRLLSSENQWRARHHVLQSENNRLQSELDATKKEHSDNLKNTQREDTVLSLPFSSTQDRSDNKKSLIDTEDHPLDRLRSGLNQLEKSETTEQISQQTEIFDVPVMGTPTAPTRYDQPEGKADDLKTIKGIGPKIETTLNSLGIYHFKQIADFTEDNINWVNDHLQFKGRIERENWVAQANELVNKSS